MKIHPLIIFLLLLSGYLTSVTGQESLRSVVGYPELKKNDQPVYKSGNEVLELPFIDDFSNGFVFPDQNRWTDAHAYVNTNFAQNAPSIGVVTLDAIDSTGAVYSHANSSSFTADYLTSRLINLDLGADTSVYLSFYYQPQGLGDAPEPRDSLVLEFWAKEDKEWVWIWSTPGQPAQDFEQVLISITGALFLTDSFRFRFKNYASLADAFLPSRKANADHWHLDYIYLDKDRHYQDSLADDLCLQSHTGSLLLNYSSIPWHHFKLASINEVSTIFPVHLKNLSNSSKLYEPVFTITDVYGTTEGFSKTLPSNEIAPLEELSYPSTFNYGFTSDAPDSALFRIELDLKPVTEDFIPGNSQTTYDQVFTNYYAYDDGSAENGYGLTGEGTNQAMIAVKFKNFNPGDSLIGMSMFFNRSFEDANYLYFQLALWADESGQPGEQIYLQSGARSGFDQGLTGFDFFPFDSVQIVPETFYAGIQQVTPDFLNIGFDVNTPNQEQIFYKTGLEWRNTSFQGSLMLRPVFANKSKKTAIHQQLANEQLTLLGVYPNPTHNLLNLSVSKDISISQLQIISISGQVMLQLSNVSRQIDVSALPPGTYYLLLSTDGSLLTEKFIKL